jgi:hypothetical protein
MSTPDPAPAPAPAPVDANIDSQDGNGNNDDFPWGVVWVLVAFAVCGALFFAALWWGSREPSNKPRNPSNSGGPNSGSEERYRTGLGLDPFKKPGKNYTPYPGMGKPNNGQVSSNNTR